MPGKTESVTITIADETWELHEPEGTQAFIVVPKLLIFVSEVLYTAGRANIDLTSLMSEDGLNLSALSSGVLPAARSVAMMLVEKWDLVQEILPILLCKDAQWLKTHGKPYEILRALWTALNFQIPGILGKEQWQSLKKSYSAGREEAEAVETQSEPMTTD